MDIIIKEAIKAIGDPFLIVLLVIIWMQFKMLIKRDDIVTSLTVEIHNNGKMLSSLVTSIEFLVYGKNKHGSNP